AALVVFTYLPHWKETKDEGKKLGVLATAPGESVRVRSYVANLVSEIIGTFFLLIGLLFIGANTFSVGLNPLVVGLLIVVIGTSLGGAIGYAIYSARDIGSRNAYVLLPLQGKGGTVLVYYMVPVIER